MPSASGAQSERTIAKAEMPGTSSRTIMLAHVLTVGERTNWGASRTISNGSASHLRFGMAEILFLKKDFSG